MLNQVRQSLDNTLCFYHRPFREFLSTGAINYATAKTTSTDCSGLEADSARFARWWCGGFVPKGFIDQSIGAAAATERLR
jgi:hypothetical protein